MRAILTTLFLAVVAAVSVSACSKPSNSAANSTAQPAASTEPAGNVASSDNAAASPAPARAPAGAGGASGAAPIYPGAVLGTRPEGVGLKTPPKSVKAYSTSDGFATVKVWYKTHLKGAPEMAQPGMEKTEDAFLVGQGPSGVAVMIQSFKGKTWILIGPPM